MSCDGEEIVNALPASIRAPLTQCVPIVGIQPNTGPKPSAFALSDDAYRFVASST